MARPGIAVNGEGLAPGFVYGYPGLPEHPDMIPFDQSGRGLSRAT